MKYAVEIHEKELGSFIKCIDKFEKESEAEKCKYKIENRNDFNYENNYVDIYKIEE